MVYFIYSTSNVNQCTLINYSVGIYVGEKSDNLHAEIRKLVVTSCHALLSCDAL
jgi:hypothetical protein